MLIIDWLTPSENVMSNVTKRNPLAVDVPMGDGLVTTPQYLRNLPNPVTLSLYICHQHRISYLLT